MKAYKVHYYEDYSDYQQILGYYFDLAKAKEIRDSHNKGITLEDLVTEAHIEEIDIEGDIPCDCQFDYVNQEPIPCILHKHYHKP